MDSHWKVKKIENCDNGFSRYCHLFTYQEMRIGKDLENTIKQTKP